MNATVSLSQHEWRDLLAGYTTRVLVGDWVAGAPADAGATTFAVVMADTADASAASAGTVPIVGAADAANFTAARILFGRGIEGPMAAAEPRTGMNFGFSTTVRSVLTTIANNGVATTDLTLTDALPQALSAGDRFTIFAAENRPTQTAWALNVQATANQPLLSDPWTAPGDGVVEMKVLIPGSGQAATASVVETQNTTATTGAASSGTGTLNAGAALEPGDWYGFTIPVLRGYLYNVQTSISQTILWNAVYRKGG